MYLYDYHMHSQNSSDGKDTISEMCAVAIASGLREIAVTDHFEPSPGNEEYLFYKPGNYFLDMLKACFVFGKDLKIKYAVELDQPHIFTRYSQKLIETHPYDYVLASAHKMADGTDFGDITYDTGNVDYYYTRYLDELKALALWNKFDCIGHLDLVKRYASKYGITVRLMDYREKLEEVLKIIIRNGKGIEVNTSGLRQSAGECLPGLDIIRSYRQLGGELITAGSDAHTAKDVGKGIREAAEMIELAGFSHMTVFTGRQPSMVKISEKPSRFHIGKQPA